MIKNWLYKIVGKNIGDRLGVSKTKVISVIAVILYAVETLSVAWGHPIAIPEDVYKLLAAGGLWTLRDAIKK